MKPRHDTVSKRQTYTNNMFVNIPIHSKYFLPAPNMYGSVSLTSRSFEALKINIVIQKWIYFYVSYLLKALAESRV